MAKKYCYLFTEGNANMREILGGKGANLAEMTNIGLPVPQGFTISTEACTQYYEDGRQINPEIQAEISEYIVKMEEVTGKKYNVINIVGGGCQDSYLNLRTAQATGLPVYAGPIEGTAIGNLIVQMIAGGDLENLQAARDAIRASFEIKEVTL